MLYLVYEEIPYSDGIFVGVFTDEERARLAAHRPYGSIDVYEIVADATYDGFPDCMGSHR